MRKSTSLLAAGITAALSFSLMAAPAVATGSDGVAASEQAEATSTLVGPSAGTKKSSNSGVHVTLKAKDLKNNSKRVRSTNWITLTVTTPGPFADEGGRLVPVSWYARIDAKGPGCGTTTAIPTTQGSASFKVPVDFKPTKPMRFLQGKYLTPGKCIVTATVTAYRYTVDAAGGIDVVTTLKTNSKIQNKTKQTFKTSAKSVKKNKTIKLSGNVKYQKTSAKSFYKYTNIKKGTKVSIQFKAKGSKSWKTIKTAKVGARGNWSSKVKVKKAGTFRTVYAGSNTTQKSTSSTKAVKVRR